MAVDYAWGLPLVVLLIGAGVYFLIASLIASGFKPIRTLKHTFDIIRGKFDDPNDPGEISHFQALTSALSATIGMGNIGGVAIAISLGGPGAIFWMWVAGAVGMATKFFTCTLACFYRKKDEDGIMQGGPMYFIEVGLGKKFKPLSIMFAVFGMIGCLALFQSNQLAGLLDAHWGVNRWFTGIVSTAIVAVVILGGITRVGLVTARVVPAMVVLYFGSAMFILLMNFQQVPALFGSIFASAFGGEAALGGAAGVAFREVMGTGVKRAAFSNEAGIGTAAMAHGAAKTKEPVREGLVAMMGPFLDTHIVCTLTALVILSAGIGASGDGVVMTVNAFDKGIPGVGRIILAIVITLFAVSTMISYSYYSLKCSRYLFGKKFGDYYIYIYLISILLAATWAQDTIINIIDTAFAMMAIPNLIGTLLLSPIVFAALKDYYARMKI
ncbi:MAG: sodium:alanine symporter family protein [candidate division Zixibacteria bacterium]|nr:sodium:alanine symporter family protein [candidate division Zixibacteria bacterium]